MRLPRGITQTPKGWRITVRPKGRPLWQKRYPSSTPLETVETALASARKKWRAGVGSLPAGTLGADITRYLKDYFTGRGGHDERQRHLELWRDALGADVWRSQITRDDIARILNGWRAAGLAAETCNKRRTALLALYHALDGKGGSNPVREIRKFRAPAPLPRGLPYTRIEQALKKLPTCKTQARLRLMAYTGLRQSQIARLQPTDWDTRRKLLTVPGTDKGRGTKPYVLPLSERATQALQAFEQADAWGAFTTAPMARMWKVVALAAKLPAGVVPYDLRHSFGTAIYRETGDLKVTKELLGHASIAMTERYTLAAVPARQLHAIHTAFPPRKKR